MQHVQVQVSLQRIHQTLTRFTRSAPHIPLQDLALVINVAVQLETIYLLDPSFVATSVKNFNQNDISVMTDVLHIPDLKPEKIGQEMAAIPADYWKLQC